MNSYYLTLVLNADQDEKARKEFLDDVKKKMVGSGGKVGKEDLWGTKNLAYSIKHKSKGFFVHFEFETEPAIAKGLDKLLRVEEDVLRFLLLRG